MILRGPSHQSGPAYGYVVLLRLQEQEQVAAFRLDDAEPWDIAELLDSSRSKLSTAGLAYRTCSA